MDIVSKINNLNEEIKSLENNKAREEGVVATLEKELKEKFDLDNLDVARTAVSNYKKEIEELDTALKARVAELKEKYPEELGGLL